MLLIWFILSAVTVKLVCATTCEEKKKILDRHNNERELVSPSAGKMQLMTYSTEMESLANKWVARCLFEHPDSTFYPEYSDFGQNLAAFGGYKPTDIYERSVFGWNQEKVNYTYSTNRCNAVCGHYTQVVWATTNSVGCAWKSCAGIITGYEEGYLVACQYQPAGNIIGRRPYMSGPSCSQCTETDDCVKKQCSKHSGQGLQNHLAICSFSIFVYAYILG